MSSLRHILDLNTKKINLQLCLSFFRALKGAIVNKDSKRYISFAGRKKIKVQRNMGYLKEIQGQIKKRDFSKLLLLWEEYCTNDSVDSDEYVQILKAIKKSDFAPPFGKYVEMGLNLWKLISDKQEAYEVLKLIFDLQTTNNEALADLAYQTLSEVYQNDPDFSERIRLIGLRSRTSSQGVLSNYDLLAHIAVGKCVYHTGGWGTGEIVEVSSIREQLAIEFEYLSGRKYLTFTNAFKTLIPLPDTHFLARRFVEPDLLEKDAKEDPIQIIKMLLRDLGPLTTGEIKDELSELVIPANDWAKWWQNARAKLKKDTLIEAPATLKDTFILRRKALTHEERLHTDINKLTNIPEVIQTSYNYVRDFPGMLKKEEVKNSIQENLLSLLEKEELTSSNELEIYIFLENFLNAQFKGKKTVKELIMLSSNIESLIQNIDIIAFKKRALVAIREYRADWETLFLSFLSTTPQSQLRDYVLKELNTGKTRFLLQEKIENLLNQPFSFPDNFVWYFQKVLEDEEDALPFSDKEGLCRCFESYLILLHGIENNPDYRDLAKKMHNILINKRYETVRRIIEGTSLEYVKEFLLLASKCNTFTTHDLKILQSLSQVVHSSLAPIQKVEDRLQLDGRVVWTTEEGYRKTQERAQRIGTIEIVENAREVEAARALGDLRENSEYKFAVEKRRHLQNELKKLSEELNRARIITEQDISSNEIGIGSIIDIKNEQGEITTYTILGPWDADTEKNILSFQSKLAQTMIGQKIGAKFSFRDEEFEIVGMKSFLSSTSNS